MKLTVGDVGQGAYQGDVSETRLPCQVADPQLFFAERPAEVELAKALCATCPIRVDCLTGALDRAEPWGVWGGELLQQGAVIPRKRPPGRPRKGEVAA